MSVINSWAATVVQLHATFKELVIEGSRRYLRALNPGWPAPIIELSEAASIVGVVVSRIEMF